ncbi:MAG: Fic family protein [Elusimicrobia bacterium]|nr:Fic family protein [Elusimicrobiota bacterium]
MDNIIDKYSWINFSINLKNLPVLTWVQLGECVSKIEHICSVPLKPTISEEMHKVYLVKGVQATTAIEGNSLTEEEVRMRLDNKLKLPPSKEYLGKEVDNILLLCNELKNKKIPSEKEHLLNCEDIFHYNKTILKEIPLLEHIIPGKYRTYSVGVGSYRAPDFNDVPLLMEKYCTWLNNSDYFIIDEKYPVLNSIVKAIVAHLYFAWIHPFGDGNGRTARIIELYILLSSGVPSPAAHLLSNHYNATRAEYYKQLDEAGRKNDVNGFVSYSVQGFLDGLKEQLKYIFSQVIETSWESYVYETFREHKHHENITKRIRSLLLELSKQNKPVLFNDLTTISKPVMEMYRNKTTKTLSRDINELEKLDMIEKTEQGYRAKIEKLLVLLPMVIK